MKKALPLVLVLVGAALLITAVVFWIDSSNSAEPQNFGQSLRDWITLLAGLGASIKGWLDLVKKESPSSPNQSNIDGGIIIGGKIDSVGKDIIGRDQVITTNIVSKDNAYNVEGLPNPYLGLQAFTYNERDRYAGREKLTNEARQRIVSPENLCNFLFITGASGSGKSSFAQAGLLPALISYYEQMGLTVHHRVFRPSRNPKARLDDALLKLGSNEIQVLIIDQFEELFTQSIPSQRDELVHYLNSLPPFNQSHRIFIATLRSDYLGEMHDSMEGLWETAKGGIPLRAMKLQEIKDAIQRPLQARFPDGSKRFEKELVEKLAQDTLEVTYLPLLQVTLETLWNKGELKLSSYGTLADAIKERADTVWIFHDFDSAHPSQIRAKKDQDQIVETLLDLVNVSTDDDTRRDVRINRQIDDFTEIQRNLLYDLSRARLVSINTEDDREIVSLIHETLIRSWDILRDSITAMRIQLQRRARFETQLRLWLSSNRADDYLLSKGQVAEARELEKSGDIAFSRVESHEFLSKSSTNIDSYEKRERMLSTVIKSLLELSSSLEQEELLNKILENAANIFDCEAGTLFLLDEYTGDLIFRVTTGPVANLLLGQRLPAGMGIAGHAVQLRMPVIENDAQRSIIRYNIDKQTGFISRSILAVPMMVKDRVLGVIEVINRRDGSPFIGDDEEFLKAFASQAAVAIENSRLLALSDQELAASVEELQVMGRISRELNASLDIDRAMRITLDWAIRQSNVDAGLIGILDDDQMHVIAQEGYENMVVDSMSSHALLDMPTIKSVIESGQPSQISLVNSNTKGLLPMAQTQIIIPLRREATVIGLLLLESTSDTQKNLAFLNRLSDNAAIAISNAQLYNAVQQVNVSKSDFVSFVAHELSNPITSIKGYTELLSAGSVGQINEMQANFLHTMHSILDRMSVLVSDLRDDAKIEAGRLRLDYKPVALDNLIDEVIRSTKRQVDDKKQFVELQLPLAMPKVWADQSRITQVLMNLVNNAHKFTPEGGKILVGAEATSNQWDPDGAKEVVHLWVKDNGIGISVEDQAKIFQRFFRSDDSKAREAPGTGLGLNITKSLVEMQGGRIWFDSEFRHGTTFHFTIPVAEG